MGILLNVVMAILLLCLVGCFYMLYRNSRVFRFRTLLTELVFHDRSNWEKKYRIFSKVSYEDMMKPFKPLRLSSYFTEEEIKILTTK